MLARIGAYCLLAAMIGSATAFSDDGGVYADSAVISGTVFTFDSSDGRFVIHKWDEYSRKFLATTPVAGDRVDGSIMCIDLESTGAAALVASEARQYSLWRIDLPSHSARRLWVGELPDELYTLHHVAKNDSWVLSGRQEAFFVRAGHACHFVSSQFPITYSAVRGNTVAIGGQLTTYSIPDRNCHMTPPLAKFAIRGYTYDVAPSESGWIGIVHQVGASHIVLLDSQLKIHGAVAIEDRFPWRLTSVGDEVIASAPSSNVAYSVVHGRVFELRLTRSIRGYACPSLMPGPARFTDGTQVVTVTSIAEVRPRRFYVVAGILIDAVATWASLFLLSLVVVAFWWFHRASKAQRAKSIRARTL